MDPRMSRQKWELSLVFERNGSNGGRAGGQNLGPIGAVVDVKLSGDEGIFIRSHQLSLKANGPIAETPSADD